jgi:alkyl hydroperoxide reductase subunit AhpC
MALPAAARLLRVNRAACLQILRVLDSLQLTAYHKVATPGNWKQGGECMVVPSVKPEEQDKVFPKVRPILLE